MRVLVTGGAGYIGSHAAARLARDGHEVLIVDSLVRGHAAAVEAVRRAAADRSGAAVGFERVDLRDAEAIAAVVSRFRPEGVAHLAALTYVGESVERPLDYYETNVGGTANLARACLTAGVRRVVFSSTAAVYGQGGGGNGHGAARTIREEDAKRPINPYGMSKLVGERVWEDVVAASRERAQNGSDAGALGVTSLRFFNVAGSDSTGLLGEDHRPETHLVPRAILSLLGREGPLTIFGADYPTRDGTCVRDYVHVEDLVGAHAAALAAVRPGESRAYNVGTGHGFTVREVIAACERAAGRRAQVVESPRRAGDPAELVACPDRIAADLGWRAARTSLDEIVASAWRWFESHPHGYGAAEA